MGLVTDRLASRAFIPKIVHPRLWNTFIHCTAAILVWQYIVSEHFVPQNQCFVVFRLDDIRLGLQLALNKILFTLKLNPSSTYTIQETCSNQQHCSRSDFTVSILLFLFKCILFSISTQVGCTLQPVGITGGIACGKTTASKILKELIQKSAKASSIFFINIDQIAHEILLPTTKHYDTAYWNIIKEFSDNDIFEDILESSNSTNVSPRNIDRRKLGDIIFNDPSKRKLLNSLTHPLITKIMMKQILYTAFHGFRRNAPFVLVDIPLLFEAGLKMKLLFGIKIVVATPHYIQLNRLSKRNPELSNQQCESRITSQMPVIQKIKMADIVVWNNETLSHLELVVEKTLVEILNRKWGYFGLSMIHMILFGFTMNMICFYFSRFC